MNSEELKALVEEATPFDRVQILHRLRAVEAGGTTLLERELALLCAEMGEALATISKAWDENRSAAMAEGKPVKRILASLEALEKP